MKKIILSAFLIMQIAGNAQESKPLTLKDAISYALENKAEAKKAKLEVENSEYKIDEVRSRALPQIAANGSLNYNPILQTTVIDGDNFGAPGTTIQAAFGQKWNSGAGISLNQTLFDQSVFIGLKAAKTTRDFYIINAQLTEEQVIERVANAYYQVLVQKERLIVIDNNLKNTNKVKGIIKGQFEVGLAKKIDLDRVIVRVNNITAQRQQILNAIALQENALKFYIGMPMESKITIQKKAFEITPLDLTATTDVTGRTEYLVLKKQEQLLLFQKKSIVAGYYPTLSLSGSYNYIGQGPEVPLLKKPENGVYWSDYSSIGLSLKVPLFSGFGTKAKVKQAENSLQSLKVDIDNTKLSLNLAYDNAKKQIENSLITINNQKENAHLAEEVRDNTNNNYIQGLTSLTDLLEAENALVEAQNNYTNAILDYKLAEIQLFKSKGELKTLTK